MPVTGGILVHPEELREDWILRMEEAGLSVLGLHPVGGAEAHISLQNAIELKKEKHFSSLLDLAARRGIRVEYEAHAMSWLLPRELFREKPEWFRQNGEGERTPDYNLCASNEEALACVAERSALLASLLDTGAHRYYFWLDDVAAGECQCPRCREFTASDQQMKILNAMLAGIRTYDPEGKLCYLAYCGTREPPKHILPAEGIFLEYAPFRRDMHRPMDDPDSPENEIERKPLKELIRFFGAEDAKVLEYWMDNSFFSNWTKPPKRFALDEAVMEKDVPYYTGLGFSSITSFGCYLGEDYEALYGKASLKRYGEILGRMG